VFEYLLESSMNSLVLIVMMKIMILKISLSLKEDKKDLSSDMLQSPDDEDATFRTKEGIF